MRTNAIDPGGENSKATPGAGSVPRWRSRGRMIAGALGAAQILAWGSSYYLLAVLAGPISDSLPWSYSAVVAGLSLGLLAAAGISLGLGKLMARFGGRNVLAASSLFFAAGLLGIALSHHYPAYLASWVLVGVAMGIGFHEAAFAAVVRLRDVDARGAITIVALATGFTSAVCWTLSALMLEHFGWRGVCVAYAALHLGVGLPLNFLALSADATEEPSRSGPVAGTLRAPPGAWLTALLALGAGLGAGISAFVSVHMLTVLQQQYMLSLPAAVALGAFISPAQVGARVIEMLVGRHWHPIWTMLGSTLLYLASCVLLLFKFPSAILPLILYGGGLGLRSVARGTLAHAITGGVGYAQLLGRIATVSLCVQAATPWVGARLIETVGVAGALLCLSAVAFANVICDGLIFLLRGEKQAIQT
ncbi:MAG: MFS transporter [Hyphomicrobiaceae bacterium]